MTDLRNPLSNRRLIRRASRILTFGLALLCGQGCHRHHQSNYSKSDETFVVAIDRSGSTVAFREAQLDDLDLIAYKAIADKAVLSVWIYDSKPLNVWDGYIQNADALSYIKFKYLKPTPSNPTQRISRPGALLSEICKDRMIFLKHRLRLYILTDGDIDDANDTPVFKSKAKYLSKREDFQVQILGLTPDNLNLWRSAFQSCPATNVTLAGIYQSQYVLTNNLKGS